MSQPSGTELKIHRIRARVHQYRVAQRIGIPPSTLSDYENGRKPLTTERAALIARAIDELAGTSVADALRTHGEVANAVA